MKNIIYDRVTHQVKGFDRDPLPFELSLVVPYPIDLRKTVEEPTGKTVQKTDADGNLLYKTNVTYDDQGVESFDETSEVRTATKLSPQTNTYKVGTDKTEMVLQDVTQPDGTIIQQEVEVPVYDEIQTIIQVPTEWTEHDPIMIPEVVTKSYTLEENCSLFTSEEVAEMITKTIPVKTTEEINTARISAVENATMMLMDMNIL